MYVSNNFMDHRRSMIKCFFKVLKACCSSPVPVWKKLGYAVGSMPYAMCLSIVGFYFSIFLLEVAVVSVVCILRMLNPEELGILNVYFLIG